MHSRVWRKSRAHLTTVVCVMCDIWLLALDHLIQTGASVPDGAVFALYYLTQGPGTAPAEEQQCAKEEGGDGDNDNANDCADA